MTIATTHRVEAAHGFASEEPRSAEIPVGTPARAIDAATERLRVLVEDEEPRQLGAIAEAAAATREVPAQLAAAFRKLAATGALQRRWDCLVARAEASSDTGEGALLSALLGLLDDAAGVAAHLLEAREILIRQRAEGVSQERRTLDWVVRESSMDSPHQTTPASSIERVGTQ